MRDIFGKYKIKISLVILVCGAIIIYLFIPKGHYNYKDIDSCQNCHLQDGDLIFLTADLSVKYTGTESCKECHKEVYDAYMNSPTGHSMSRVTENNVIEKFPQDYEIYDSTKNYYYEMLKKDSKFYQREYRLDPDGNIVHERWMEAQYIIGSGTNLRIYFYDENGMFYQLPLTWYVNKQKWDMSPGYREFNNNRFSRYAGSMCFSCHNGHTPQVKDANNRYEKPFHTGIGCEDCHGPGELHIKQTKDKELSGIPDFVKTIVNPVKLSPERRNDVCLQCHIEGKSWALHDMKSWFDFRPGLLLKDHRSVYTTSKQTKHSFLVADTGNRMFLSPCYTGSHGQLTCDFCHTSHNTYEVDKIKYNRQSCMRCHPIEGLPMRESRFIESREDCNRCHMNKAPSDNTLHGVIDTDHWIRINSDWDKVDWSSERLHTEKLILTPIVDKKDSACDIRHGIAYAEYYFNENRSNYYLDSASYYLKNGLKLVPENISGNYYLGKIESIKRNFQNSEKYLKNAIQLYPEYSDAYYELALLYKKQNNYGEAIASIKEAIIYKKNEPVYLELLGSLYYDVDSVMQAVQVLNSSLKIDKQNPNVFFILGNIAVLKQNDPQSALRYYKKAVELNPDITDGLINLGNTYAVLGEYEKAIESYKKELVFRKESVKAYINLARISTFVGDTVSANDALNKARLINPTLEF
ncbi:MAG: tetratricopeptide repeat protein [Ignavibacteriaceae bacterium]|jgi:tetratricopeptide (TPR) repeat protein